MILKTVSKNSKSKITWLNSVTVSKIKEIFLSVSNIGYLLRNCSFLWKPLEKGILDEEVLLDTVNHIVNWLVMAYVLFNDRVFLDVERDVLWLNFDWILLILRLLLLHLLGFLFTDTTYHA